MERHQEKLEKYFKKMALPDFSITQSPFIIINKVRYAIIGQFPLQSFLFSHFDVIDEDGYQADDHTAYKVYRYISMIQIAGFIEMMEEWFDKTIDDINDDATGIIENFNQEYKRDILEVIQENKGIQSKLHTLSKERERLSAIDEWEENDFQAFQSAWDHFWDTYEKRLKILFDFKNYIWENDENIHIQQTSLHSIYQEAEEMYQLFSASLSVEQPVIDDVGELIQVTGELGRISSEESDLEVLTPFERFSMHFFEKTYKFSFWITLPISLIYMVTKLVIDGSFSKSPFIFLMLAIIFLTMHLTDKNDRKAKMERRIRIERQERLGQHPIIKSKYYQDYHDMQIKQMQTAEQAYEFIATPTVIWRGMLVASFITLLMGIGLLDSDSPSHDYGYGYLTAGIIILILRIVLPLFGFAHIRFQLTSDGLKRGKKKITYFHNILEVAVNPQGSIFAIDMGLQYRQKFKIKKAYRNHTKGQLKVWCDKHGLNYRNKLYFWEKDDLK